MERFGVRLRSRLSKALHCLLEWRRIREAPDDGRVGLFDEEAGLVQREVAFLAPSLQPVHPGLDVGRRRLGRVATAEDTPRDRVAP